jgi:hypothetical protein
LVKDLSQGAAIDSMFIGTKVKIIIYIV